MASNKKRRKRDSVTRRIEGAKPAAASDGDRRRRRAFGSLVDDALRRKRASRDWTIDEGPPPGI
ncbi:hypothetical protein AB1L88_18575 [Tautonia sp. JC769]|uniref:hypothetical protein n=1 Tax=Tautonia sp. JC769 TaxID=3232135 RepID=UPI003458AB4A